MWHHSGRINKLKTINKYVCNKYYTTTAKTQLNKFPYFLCQVRTLKFNFPFHECPALKIRSMINKNSWKTGPNLLMFTSKMDFSSKSLLWGVVDLLQQQKKKKMQFSKPRPTLLDGLSEIENENFFSQLWDANYSKQSQLGEIMT